MSFWGMFKGDNGADLPSAGSAAPTGRKQEPAAAAGPPPTTAGAPPIGAPPIGAPPIGAPPIGAPPIGAPPKKAVPPLTGNTYLHTPLHSPVQPPRATLRTPPVAVPTFQIFTPKSSAETTNETPNFSTEITPPKHQETGETPPVKQPSVVESGGDESGTVAEEEASHEPVALDPPAVIEAVPQTAATVKEEPILAKEPEESDSGDSYDTDDDDDDDDDNTTADDDDDDNDDDDDDNDDDEDDTDDDDDDDIDDEEEEGDEWDWDDDIDVEGEREAVPAITEDKEEIVQPSDQQQIAGEEDLMSAVVSPKNNTLQKENIDDTNASAADEDDGTFVLRRLEISSPVSSAKVISPSKANRFEFLKDESIPIPKLEGDFSKRRHEHRSRMYEMDCNLAGLEALCVEESLDRDAAMRHIFPGVCLQLERLSNRYLGNKISMDDEKTRMLAIHRRVGKIHAELVHHKHETMNTLMTDELESIGLDLLQSVRPSMQMEASKADKREGTLFRKFDSLAGTVARRFHEESATRIAATALLEEQISGDIGEQQTRYLEQLRKLRTELRKEREARKETDAKVLKDVHETCAGLMRAVLEAAGESK